MTDAACATESCSLPPSLSSWLAHAALFAVLSGPNYFILAAGGAPGLIGGALVLALPWLTLPLVFVRKASKVYWGLAALQVVLAWLGFAAASVFWIRVFPETPFFLLTAALAGFSFRRGARALIPLAFALTGSVIMAVGYGASAGWVLGYLGALAAASWLLRFARGVSAAAFRSVAAGVAALQLLVYALTSFIYYVDERANGDARQEGVSALALPLVASREEYPLHQLTMFLTLGGRTLLFPRHQSASLRVEGDDRVTVTETDGVVTNGLVLDSARDRFFVASGSRLYQGSMRTLEIEERADLDPTGRSRGVPPAFVDAPPAPLASRLLVVFDGLGKVVIFDVESGRRVDLRLPYKVSSGVWHPGGEKLVLYGKDTWYGGHLLLVDLLGRVLVDREAGLFDRVELRRGAEGVLAMFFLRGRLELISPDTLESVWSVSTSMPRAVVPSNSGRCLLVPSYSRGTLGIRRALGGELLKEIRIGRRVRAITTSPDGNAYWISSSRGPLVVDDFALPEECRAR